MSKNRSQKSPSYLFNTLASKMVGMGLLTNEDVNGFLETAKADGTTQDIYDTGLRLMVRECNKRLRERGKKRGR